MSKKTEKELEQIRINQQLEELAAEKKRNLANQQEQDSKAPVGEEDQEDEQCYQIQSNLLKPDAWKEILKDYENEDYAKPRTEHGALVFPGPEEAKKFFQEQAGKNREFLATYMKDGQLQDSHYFSCGDGQLYSGSYQDINSQLQKALITASESNREKIESGIKHIETMQQQRKPTTAQEMRAKVQGLKDEGEANQDLANDKSPSPLSIINKP